MRKKVMLISMVVIMLLAGCGIGQKQDRVESLSKRLESAQFSQNDYEKIVTPTNDLGILMLEKLPDNENVFVSSLSLYFALSMLYNGADGVTKEEMAQVLGNVGISAEDLSRANASLIATLEKDTDDIMFSIANSIWIRNDLQFQDDFAKRNQDYLLAKVEEVDFGTPETADKINRWVSDATRGKIEKMVEPPIGDDVVTMLINAIYFKGTWTHEFPKEKTKPDDFYLTDGTHVEVEMMNQSSRFKYMENEIFQAVKLPYGNEEVSMNVFLPKEDMSTSHVIDYVKTNGLTEMNDAFDFRLVDLTFPKFELDYEIDLSNMLQEIGMPSAFSPNHADFSKMFEGDMDVYVDIVKQKSYIKVDEKETEAAAVTQVVMKEMLAEPIESVKMNVNCPFIFMITDNETDTVLFTGSIVNPK